MKHERVNYDYDYSIFSTKSPGFRIFLLILVIAAVSAFAMDLLNARSSRDAIKGLDRTEVISLFYNSYNSYDLRRMESCVNGKYVNAGNNRILANTVFSSRRNMEEVTHGGAQLGQEGIYITPADWIRSGKPALKRGQCVEGIHNLKITETDVSNYAVSYDYYFTGPVPEGVSPQPQVFSYTDLCSMEKYKDSWIINRIEQL